jgi:hypothetical protein
MSKTVSFTSEKWGGSVTFSDPLSMPQEAAFEMAQAEYRTVFSKGGGLSAQMSALLAGVLPCVEKWDLKNFPDSPTLANWPTRPKQEVAKLVAWLLEQCAALYMESVEIPNASRPAPTLTPQAPAQPQENS